MSSEDQVIRRLKRKLSVHELCKAMGWKPQYILGSNQIHGYMKGLKIIDEDAFMEQEYWTKEELSAELKKMADESFEDLQRNK